MLSVLTDLQRRRDNKSREVRVRDPFRTLTKHLRRLPERPARRCFSSSTSVVSDPIGDPDGQDLVAQPERGEWVDVVLLGVKTAARSFKKRVCL